MGGIVSAKTKDERETHLNTIHNKDLAVFEELLDSFDDEDCNVISILPAAKSNFELQRKPSVSFEDSTDVKPIRRCESFPVNINSEAQQRDRRHVLTSGSMGMRQPTRSKLQPLPAEIVENIIRNREHLIKN